MRQYFSNAADPVLEADDATAVPVFSRVAAPDVPAADAVAAVTDAAAISTAACVAAPVRVQ